jgi:hypothetical protein
MEIDKKERALWQKGKVYPKRRLINRYNKYYDAHSGNTLLGTFNDFVWRTGMDKKFAILDFKDIKLLGEGSYFSIDVTEPPLLYAVGKTYEVWVHIEEHGKFLRFVDKTKGGYGYHVFTDFSIDAYLISKAERSVEMVMMDLLYNIKKYNEQNTRTDTVLGKILQHFEESGQLSSKKTGPSKAVWGSP